MPCSASGIAQPRITSSISRASSCGMRSSAPRIATAARSSGRLARSVPLNALPTGVRTEETITTSRISQIPVQFCVIAPTAAIAGDHGDSSIPQRLARLQGVLNTLLRLALAAERLEAFTLQIQDVLLRDHGSGRDGASAKHFGDFVPDFHFMV